MTKITAEHYYDPNPALVHSTGDIWSDLPSNGILGLKPVSGIVITPGCDLAQSKVETITYLPVIPAMAYFSLTAALPEIRRAIDGQLKAASLDGMIDWQTSYSPPSMATVEAADALLAERERDNKIGGKERAFINRARAGMRILRLILQAGIFEVPAADANTLFGEKEWASVKSRIVTNSFRSDVHFLPADCQREDWSGIPKHSLVLFRYPITAPIEIFDAAQDISLKDWSSCCQQMTAAMPFAASFAVARPMKRLVLKTEFISDLLTRFVAMYVRLGSPDFTAETVSLFCDQIEMVK